MKKIFLFFLLAFTQFIFAQFTASDVKNIVGTGDKIAYVVVDFKDGTDDRSYAWGVKFSTSENAKIFNLLQKIQSEEPAFSFQGTSFLDGITFNSHSQSSGTDWWSTWSGSSASTFGMNGGMSGSVNDGGWYGFSYGFSNPTSQAPIIPIAAYSSTWFPMSNISNWIGNGTNRSVIVIDFGTDTGNTANSFAYGIQYDGNISAEQALQLIKNQNSNFDFTITNGAVTSVSLNNFSGTNAGTNVWKSYKGTNLSNWKTQTNIAQTTLENNTWFGVSFGTRRPFTPQVASFLGTNDSVNIKAGIKIYPNPATEYVHILTEEKILSVNLFSMTGQKVVSSTEKKINIKHLSSGTYILDVTTQKGRKSFKLIKN